MRRRRREPWAPHRYGPRLAEVPTRLDEELDVLGKAVEQALGCAHPIGLSVWRVCHKTGLVTEVPITCMRPWAVGITIENGHRLWLHRDVLEEYGSIYWHRVLSAFTVTEAGARAHAAQAGPYPSVGYWHRSASGDLVRDQQGLRGQLHRPWRREGER